jgi:hypothetical protein
MHPEDIAAFHNHTIIAQKEEIFEDISSEIIKQFRVSFKPEMDFRNYLFFF